MLLTVDPRLATPPYEQLRQQVVRLVRSGELPAGARLPKVSMHIPICNEPPQMVRQTLDALAELDYPEFEALVVDYIEKRFGQKTEAAE